MSMNRQLWLSILLSMLIALGASLFASLLNARAYLEAQLAMKNQDNATTLALALSQGNSDRDSVILAATALFNSGHYQLVHVVTPDGKRLLEKVAVKADAGAPDWFVQMLPIRSLPGSAEIASGWQPLGSLTLMSHPEFAYRSLWQTALTMSAVIFAAGLLGGMLASLVVRRVTQPMGRGGTGARDQRTPLHHHASAQGAGIEGTGRCHERHREPAAPGFRGRRASLRADAATGQFRSAQRSAKSCPFPRQPG